MSIQYINANAGTGKTYHLTSQMTKYCANGLDPEQFIFTTFTRSAASDFKDRARDMMFENGLIQKANRIDMALIGTIDSVAQSFVFKYWYLLGLSPKLNIMTSATRSGFEAMALDSIYSDSALMDKFAAFREFFGITDYDFWKSHLLKIVEGETLYNFYSTPVGAKCFFNISKKKSLAFCRKLWNGKSFKYHGVAPSAFPTVIKNAVASLQIILANENTSTTAGLKRFIRLNDFIKELNTAPTEATFAKFLVIFDGLTDDYTKAEKKVSNKTSYEKLTVNDPGEDLVEQLLSDVENVKNLHDSELSFIKTQKYNIANGTFDWQDIYNKWVNTDSNGKTSIIVTTLAKDVVDFYNDIKDIYLSVEAKNLIDDYIRTIFELAKKWESEYSAFKQENHLLEYHDIERYFLTLLSKQVVQNDIKSQYEMIFVDEFQDCSPLQVKIFYEMSKLINDSIWVGDKKQSIYGFRGANLELNDRVADYVSANGVKGTALTTNYRSFPGIVHMANFLFRDIYGRQGCSSSDPAKLKAHGDLRKKNKTFRSLHYLDYHDRNLNETQYYEAIAAKIESLINEGYPAKEIAVLMLTNNNCDKMTAALNKFHIPVNRGLSDLKDNKTMQLVSALLKLVVSSGDRKAKATVATLTTDGFDAGRILDNALLDSEHFLSSVPLLKVFNDKKKRFNYAVKPLSVIVKSLVYELDLNRFVHQWEFGDSNAAVLDFVCNLAVSYEDRCKEQSLPSTVEGFRLYMQNLESISDEDNNLSVGALSDGVVVTTCHKSKGLQWDVVIMPNLDFEPTHHPIKKALEQGVEGVHMQEGKPLSTNKSAFESCLKYMWMRLFPIPLKHVREKVAAFRGKRKNLETELQETAIEEKLRLLYVSVTRPKKMLYVASNTGSLEWLSFIEKKVYNYTHSSMETVSVPQILENNYIHYKYPIITEKYAEKAAASNVLLDKFVSVEKMLKKLGWPEISDIKAQLAPSSTYGTFVSNLLSVTPGSQNRYTKSGNQDENGTLVHNIFCSLEKLDPSVRVDEIDRMIKDSGLAANFETNAPQCINEAWNYLEAWLKKQGGIIAFYHELPFIHMNGDFQLVAGDMDLLCEYGDKQVILVDYKTYPGALHNIITPTEKHYAGRYAGQFRCYRDALEAGGYTVIHSIVYYPEIQTIVELDLDNPV